MELFKYKEPIALMAKAKYFGMLSLIVVLALKLQLEIAYQNI